MSRHECGLDRTYCDCCGEELEVGFVGLCENCLDDADTQYDEDVEDDEDVQGT